MFFLKCFLHWASRMVFSLLPISLAASLQALLLFSLPSQHLHTPQALTPVFSLYRCLLSGGTQLSKTSAELGSHISNCLFNISIWICNMLPQCSMSEAQFLICTLPTSTSLMHVHSPILCERCYISSSFSGQSTQEP